MPKLSAAQVARRGGHAVVSEQLALCFAPVIAQCPHGEDSRLNCDVCDGYTDSRFYREMIATLGYDLRDRGGPESVWSAS